MKTQRTSLGLLFLSSAALCLLNACSSLSVDLPVSRFELPETNGREAHRTQISAQLESSHKYEMTPDAGVRPPNFSRPTIDTEAAFGAHGSYGIADHFDLSLKTSLGRSPWMLFGKYQILGENLENATEGNVSLALTGGVGYAQSTNKGDQNGTFGAGGYNWEGQITTLATDAALIAGYRASDSVLFYASGFYSNYRMEAKINQSASDNGLSAGGEYRNAENAYQRGANLGLALSVGTRGLLKLEGIYSDLATGRPNNWILSYGASMGTRF